MYKQKLNPIYSWVAIVIFLIVFWPVGLYLLFKRISLDKAAALKNSKTIKVIGWILIVMGIFGLIGSETANDGAAILFVFGIGGVCLLFVSRRLRRNGEKYRHYIGLIVNQGEKSIDNIARIAGVTYEVVKKDLQKMIDAGYFRGAYINDVTREFLLPQQSMQVPPAAQGPAMQSNQTKVVACGGCGANNTVFQGRATECDYCGAPING